MLSSRAAVYLGQPEFLMKYFRRCTEDPYRESSNKGGYVNLGMAVNALCEEEINRRLNQGDLWRHTPVWQHYFGTTYRALWAGDLVQETKTMSNQFSAQPGLRKSKLGRAFVSNKTQYQLDMVAKTKTQA